MQSKAPHTVNTGPSTVADPGFPEGEGAIPKVGVKNLLFWPFFLKTAWNWEKKWIGGVAVIAPRPLAPPPHCTLPKNCANFGFLPLDQRTLSPCRFCFCCRIHWRPDNFCHIFCLDSSRFILVGSSLLFQFHQVGHDVSLQLNQRACRSTVLVPTYYLAKYPWKLH